MEIFNSEVLPAEFMRKDSVGLITKALGAAGGCERIYVNIDSVPPGAYSTKYHSHSQQEEFFLVLSGSGTVRLNNQDCPVEKGDFFAKPAGENNAHAFFNSGKENLVILDVGTVEKEDTCYYPDEKIYMQKSNKERRVFSAAALENHWDSEPNTV